MHKIGIVAKHEYFSNLKRPAFLFSAFGMPLFFIVLMVFVIVFTINEDDTVEYDELGEGLYSIGVIDHANLITDEAIDIYKDLFTRYDDEESARADLEAEILDAYTVVSEDYLETGTVQLFSIDGGTEFEWLVGGLMNNSLGESLAGNMPSGRIIDPVGELTIIIQDTGREVNIESVVVLLVLPFVFGFVFIFATQTTSGFLVGGLAEEKTNHIMEILVTSITPMELMGGKIIGLALLGLTQLLIWVAAAIIIFVFAVSMGYIEGIAFPVDLTLIAIVYFLLGYFLMASLLAGLGAVVGTEQEGRQYAGILSILLYIPWFFITQFIETPNGTLPVVLSIFPFTAPMAMTARFGITAVPAWQLALSMGLILVTSIVAAWISAKVFRWALLMTGKRFNFKLVYQIITGKDSVMVQDTKEANA